MLTSLKIAAAAAALACGSLAAATPAHAATVPECTSYVKITQPNSTFFAYKPAHQGSTTCWLDRGSYGAGVWALQRNLKYCYGQNIATDSSFGPETEQALKNAQARHGLVRDGSYGPSTRAVLIPYYTIPSGEAGGC